MSCKSVILALLFCMIATGSQADEVAIQVDHLTDRVIQLYPAISQGADKVIAVNSDAGIVIIDTGTSYSLSRQYRSLIAETFGRDDFKYVINTHHCYDHMVGNQTFADAIIVGHEQGLIDMRVFQDDIADYIKTRQEMVANWQAKLADLDPESEQAQGLQGMVISYGMMCTDLQDGFELTLPTLVFNDRMVLNLGDLTLRLYHYGPGTHSDSDVVVHIPEEGLVASGDLFWKSWIQYSDSPDLDPDRLLAVLDAVLAVPSAGERELELVVPCHEAPLSGQDLKTRRDYLAQLWAELQAAVDRGEDRATVMAHLSPVDCFVQLEDIEMEEEALAQQHRTNVERFWELAVRR